MSEVCLPWQTDERGNTWRRCVNIPAGYHAYDEMGEVSMVLTRERIKTDNELYGSGILDESAPGLWAVLRKSNTGKTTTIAHIFTNRDAAEAYIHDKCEEHGIPTTRYALQVWQASETWPDEDES